MADPRHILLVEDEEPDAQHMLRMLARFPFVVTRAATYAETMSAAPPDVVLLDLRVPGADDPIRFVRDVADRFPTAGIVVCTGFDDENYGVKAKAAGAQERLVKGTFDPKRLHIVIREAHAAKRRELDDIRKSRTNMTLDPMLLEDAVSRAIAPRLSDLGRYEKIVLDKLRKLAPDTDVHDAVEPQVRSVFAWMRANWKLIGGIAGWATTLVAAAAAYVTQLRDDTSHTRAMVEEIRRDVRELREGQP